jgi:sugar phosphate isomerase/epimerase
MKIATFADWFGVGTIDGIKESARVGAQGVQLFAWKQLDPYKATQDIISEVRKVAQDHGQAITALCGELGVINPGGHGLQDVAKNPQLIDFLKRVVDLAGELGCDVVTTHIGVIPEDKNCKIYEAMQNACRELSEHAAKMDAWLAIETGPELVSTLCEFVDSIPGGRIAVNYDPANLIMVTNDDEVKGVVTAGKRIVHTHAKDGVMKKYIGPEHIYGIFSEGGVEALETLVDLFAETPLGQGSVRWQEYLSALRDIGYTGYLTIEREVGKDATADIQMAVEFLKKQLAVL